MFDSSMIAISDTSKFGYKIYRTVTEAVWQLLEEKLREKLDNSEFIKGSEPFMSKRTLR